MAILQLVFLLLAQPTDQPDRLPVPSQESQKQLRAVVREVFAAEFREVDSKESRVALAERLIARSRSSKDPAERYVLLSEAIQVARVGPVFDTMFRACDEIVATFDVEVLTAKGKLLYGLSKNGLDADSAEQLVDHAHALLEEAVQAERYDLAQAFGKLADTQARKTGNTALVKKAVASNRELARRKTKHDKVVAARRTLEGDPADKEANLILGTYLCLTKKDWESGLPHLALSSDDELQKLAVKELALPQDATAAVELGDGWWELAERRGGDSALMLKRHAVSLYHGAVGGLAGLQKDLIAKRIHEFDARYAETEPVRTVKKTPKAPDEATIEIGKDYNLLALIDPQKNHFWDKNLWAKDPVTNVVKVDPGGNQTGMGIPFIIDGEYDLAADVKLVNGIDGLLFRLPVGEGCAGVSIHGYPLDGGYSWLSGTSHRAIRNPNAYKGLPLTRGDRHQVMISVRKLSGEPIADDVTWGVAVVLNGKKLFVWKGKNTSELAFYGAKKGSWPAVEVNKTSTYFYSIRFRLVSGTAKIAPGALAANKSE